MVPRLTPMLEGAVEPARSQRLWLPPHARPCAGSSSPVSRPSQPWLEPVQFDYRVSQHELALVCLLADLDAALGPPNAASLLVRRAAERTRYPAAAETMPGRPPLWQVSFEVPLDVVESPQALFSLQAPDRIPIALPAPGRRPDVASFVARAPSRPFRPLIRRAATAFATGVAFAAVYGSCASVAAADSAPGTTPSSSATSATTTASAATTGNTGQPPSATAGTTTTGNTAQPPSATAGTTTTGQPPSTTAGTTTTGNAGQAPSTPASTTTTGNAGQAPSTTTGTTTTANTTSTSGQQPSPSPSAPPLSATSGGSATGAATTAPASPAPGPAANTPPGPGLADAGSALAPKAAGAQRLACPSPRTRAGTHTIPSSQPQPSSRPSSPSCVQPKKTRKKPNRHARRRGATTPAGAPAEQLAAGRTTSSAGVPATPWTDGVAIDPFTAAQIEQFSAVSANLDQPPAFLIPIYKAAGRRYDIPWQILAAINAIETGYGEDLSISPAGAMGWMQFMPGTWARFGVGAAGDSRPNPYDPRDAILSAARYLAANGGSQDIRRALFAYNHALWYVDAVLWRAQLITDRAIGHAGPSGYALPLDPVYMRQLGRTDDGLDIEDAPDGAAVYSITPGVVTAVASDPTGFGPDYPVILVTAGPLAGQYIYYGHVTASLVTVGQRVLSGQPIAIMGHTGDAAGLGHGHIEIGFSDASGDPLNHHGAMAWTPSGAVMRTVIMALTHRFASLVVAKTS